MKTQANKHKWDVKFTTNNWVYVKIRPYWMHSLEQKHNKKLSWCFFGPYKVVEGFSKITYWLALSLTSWVHLISCFASEEDTWAQPPGSTPTNNCGSLARMYHRIRRDPRHTTIWHRTRGPTTLETATIFKKLMGINVNPLIPISRATPWGWCLRWWGVVLNP